MPDSSQPTEGGTKTTAQILDDLEQSIQLILQTTRQSIEALLVESGLSVEDAAKYFNANNLPTNIHGLDERFIIEELKAYWAAEKSCQNAYDTNIGSDQALLRSDVDMSRARYRLLCLARYISPTAQRVRLVGTSNLSINITILSTEVGAILEYDATPTALVLTDLRKAAQQSLGFGTEEREVDPRAIKLAEFIASKRRKKENGKED